MAITFGSGSAPSQVTINLDALFAQSLANYDKSMADNISTTNPFMHEIREGNFYEGEEGGTDIRLPLMYALAQADAYDAYDELPDGVTDGVSQSVWEWRQMAVPISYNMREVIQNKEKLIDLVDTKIAQSEMGFQESWASALFDGAGDAALATAKTSSVTGASFFEPLAKLVHFTPSASVTIGNISQSANIWWRNITKTSAATDLTGLILELENLYNTCSKGVGGPPNQLLTDQVSYEAFCNAIYLKWRKTDNSENNNYPFEFTRFKRAKLMWDEKMHDAYSGLTAGTGLTFGTLYALNTKFFRVKYIKGREFEMLKDEHGKTFAKPLKGDSRLGHMAWMGQICTNNRRKHGVLGKIARTFTNT